MIAFKGFHVVLLSKGRKIIALKKLIFKEFSHIEEESTDFFRYCQGKRVSKSLRTCKKYIQMDLL